jgi:N-formylmaleamate deformylase
MVIVYSENDIVLNGAQFHYLRTGHGKTPLVLLHGFSDNGRCWLPEAEELQDYDVILPDARGHGLSERVQPEQSIDPVADIAGLIEALGLDRPIVGGHSMGAMTASRLGARHPDLVRALLLEDPPWFIGRPQLPRTAHIKDSPLGNWIIDLQKQSLEQVLVQCRSEHPAWSEATARYWCEGKFQLDPNFLTSRNVFEGSWQDEVSAYACPVLLVRANSRKGGIVTARAARIAVEKNPRIQVVQIKGASHHVRFDRHAEYMEKVKAFLAQIERAG